MFHLATHYSHLNVVLVVNTLFASVYSNLAHSADWNGSSLESNNREFGIRHARETPSWRKADARPENIFIETVENSTRQFFKLLGQTALDELFREVRNISDERILVTGGAGFVGSHLVDSLMLDGNQVVVCDDFSTGRRKNVEHWLGHPKFELIQADVAGPSNGCAVAAAKNISQIYHLASPASPVHYMADPVQTIKTISLGTMNMLELAKHWRAPIVLASTSEVYGDPAVNPQPETYWGNANPTGPRSCYDESKRLAESMAVAYKSHGNVSVGVARIFNTYGPRMQINDGRVVSNFVVQALKHRSLTIYGDGQQTRSFQYISDLVAGLKKLMRLASRQAATIDGLLVVNLGNPEELTIGSLAETVKRLVPDSRSDVVNLALPIDDPHRRRPDIGRAAKVLDWRPRVSLSAGLRRTIEYFSLELSAQ